MAGRLTIDLRAKNSAPSLDPRWSAHAQVRALSAKGVTHQISSSLNRGSESQHVSESHSPQLYFTPSNCNDYSVDSISHCNDYEKDINSKASSQRDVQLSSTLNMDEISCPAVEPFSMEDPSCNYVCNLDETRINVVFPGTLDVNSDKKEQEFLNVGSSNLSENDYEELLRVYRERVW
jgi:hypothetical protein